MAKIPLEQIYTKKTSRSCPKCKKSGYVRYYVWESLDGAFEDDHFRCFRCTYDWWVDGIDS